MVGIFHFKQFDVDQSGCAMRINTDGVLLGAFAETEKPQNILDIGTGTGVIALMLAQKFADARIDAVEIDPDAAQTAERNFKASSFTDRLSISQNSFQHYFELHPERNYDIIVSNPPFYIHSLAASKKQMNVAKHTDRYFFEELIISIAKHLTKNGNCWLVLPLPTAGLVRLLLADFGLHLNKTISIYSFEDSDPHREILVFGMGQIKHDDEKFVIYDEPKKYTQAYKNKLKDFFTIF